MTDLTETIISRETIYKGKYLNLNRLNLKFPDGKNGIREAVDVKNAAAVLPLDKDNNVHLVKQYRAPIEKTIIEIPAGILDKGPNETVEDCAKRECEEETGYYPQKLIRLLTYSHAEGYSNGFITLYLGKDLIHTKKINLDDSEYLQQISMHFDELLKMVKSNEIIDSKTLLAVLLSQDYIK